MATGPSSRYRSAALRLLLGHLLPLSLALPSATTGHHPLEDATQESNPPTCHSFGFISFICRLFQVKVKGKPSNDRPPYFDFSVLRLKSLRMILLSSGIGSVGAYTPLFYLVRAPIDLSTIFFVVRRHSFHPPTHRRLATRKFRNKSKRHTLRDKAQAKSDGLKS